MTTIDFLRQFRLGEYAIFDLTVSFLGMALLSPLLSIAAARARLHVPKRNWVFLTLPIGVLVHVIVGRITPMTAKFLDPSGGYVTKIVIVGCILLGATGIRRIPAEKPKH